MKPIETSTSMKIFITIFYLCFSVIVTGQPIKPFSFDGSKYIGKQFSKFIFENNGDTLTNSDFNGKVVFINFWFIGCPPCRAEMNGLNQMYNKLKDSANFMIVSISFDSDSEIKEFKEQNKIEYKIYHIDRQECYQLNFHNGFPTSFILGKDGVIKWCKMGGYIDTDKATKVVMKEIYPEIIKEL